MPDHAIVCARWAAVAVLACGLAIWLIGPRPGPDLEGGFDSIMLAAELARTPSELAARVGSQRSHFFWAVVLDFPLMLAYTVLFLYLAQMERTRGGWYRVSGVVAAGAVWPLAVADVIENVGLLVPDRVDVVLGRMAPFKWGALGVVLVAVSFLFIRRPPLASEFHVALSAAWFFFFVAGLIALYGALVDELKLEHVGLPLVLGLLTQAAIMAKRRDAFREHLAEHMIGAEV